jgi:hypothetical protein
VPHEQLRKRNCNLPGDTFFKSACSDRNLLGEVLGSTVHGCFLC